MLSREYELMFINNILLILEKMETLPIIASALAFIIILLIVIKIISMMKGKIIINLSNFNFSSGESITGTVILQLKKPMQAKSLKVGLVAESSSRSIRNNKPNNSRTSVLFKFDQSLDGEKLYVVGEHSYNFSIKVPNNVVNSTGNAIADTLVKSAQILSGNLSSIRWYVTAELETSGFNISKRVQVNVG